jgi:hypothetical protein
MTYKWTFEEIPLDRIFVDGELQRPEQRVHINKIAREYSDLLAQVPVLSDRDNGYYHTLDGQHGIKAKRLLGVTTVMAMVYHGLTRAEEARAFVGRNGQRKAVANIHNFRVAVEAESELEVALQRILSVHGWTVGTSGGSFAAVVTLRKVAQGPNGLVAASNVIETISRAWGHDPAGVHRNIVAGLGVLYNKREIDMDRMARRLGSVHPLAILREADVLTVGTAPVRNANVMLKHYNKGLRENRIPDLVRA